MSISRHLKDSYSARPRKLPMIRHTIKLEKERIYYTNGDTVEGAVDLLLLKDAQIRALDIKLCCRETIVADISSGFSIISRFKEERKVFTDTYRAVGDDRMNQLHVLPSGQKHFPFRFVIPRAAQYQLSSFDEDLGGGVRWYIKLVLRRTRGRGCIRDHKLFTVKTHTLVENNDSVSDRYIPFESFETCGTLTSNHKDLTFSEGSLSVLQQEVGLILLAQVPDVFSSSESRNCIHISFFCSYPEHVQLIWLEIAINEVWNVCANKHSRHDIRRYTIFKGPLKSLSPSNRLERLTEAAIEVKLPECLFVGLSTAAQRVDHRLSVDAQVTSSFHGKQHKKLRVEPEITISDYTWNDARKSTNSSYFASEP